MVTFAPTYLANWTHGRWLSLPSQPLQAFTQDTRALKPGQVFVAIKTDKRDGHDFLPAAVLAGASAALVSRPDPKLALPQLVVSDTLQAFQAIAREHRRGFGGRVIGVTGSCGKTSTKNLLAHILGTTGGVLATEGNLNNHLGVPLTLTRLDGTMHSAAVVEAGISGPGEMAVLAEMIQPDCGIVTLVAPAHTEELGGLEGVAGEKSVLLRHLRPRGLGVIPHQCWAFSAFQDLPQTTVVVAPEGDPVIAPRVVRYRLGFTAERVEIAMGARRFGLRRVTRGMAQNAVLAITLASELGLTDDAIERALTAWEPAKWRGEIRREGARLLYLDFYNANPASMADALDTFFAVAPAGEPRLLVLGCMEELGPEASKYHRELGRSLRLRADDRAFVIGAEAAAVIAGAQDAGVPAERLQAAESVEQIARVVAGFRGAVFVKGSRRYSLEKVLPSTGAVSSQGAVQTAFGGGAGSGLAARTSALSSFHMSRTASVLPAGWRFPQMTTRSGRGQFSNYL